MSIDIYQPMSNKIKGTLQNLWKRWLVILRITERELPENYVLMRSKEWNENMRELLHSTMPRQARRKLTGKTLGEYSYLGTKT